VPVKALRYGAVAYGVSVGQNTDTVRDLDNVKAPSLSRRTLPSV
jgi:hypothetical protein